MIIAPAPLRNTSWSLVALNGQTHTLATPITLAFSTSTLTAKICSTRTATYITTGNTLSASRTTPLNVLCAVQLQPYQQAFDLSAATYAFSGNMLVITTSEGDMFLWKPMTSPLPNPGPHNINLQQRIYGFVVRQLNQVMKARGIDTIDQKQVFIQSILDRLNNSNGLFK